MGKYTFEGKSFNSAIEMAEYIIKQAIEEENAKARKKEVEQLELKNLIVEKIKLRDTDYEKASCEINRLKQAYYYNSFAVR